MTFARAISLEHEEGQDVSVPINLLDGEGNKKEPLVGFALLTTFFPFQQKNSFS